jgi:inosine-uridine nucleoside N-ribohydrolase
MALTHPELFTTKTAHVEIAVGDPRTMGMTVIDQRDLREVPPGNCQWQTHVQADAAWDVVVEAIAHFSH